MVPGPDCHRQNIEETKKHTESHYVSPCKLNPQPCLIYILFFFFLQYHVACRVLVPLLGIEPMPTALGTWSLNHWTTKEAPFYIHYLLV